MTAADDPTREVAHRPWPLPQRPWLMAQRWSNLLFAHWPVRTHAMRALVPSCLELDLHDGTAWVSIAPFSLSNMHPRGLPALPWLSDFLELNVRTYVTVGGRPGVYFFSLDAAKLPPVIGARTAYHLPYFCAEMRMRCDPDGTVHYHSRRAHPGAAPAAFDASYAPAGPVHFAEPGSLDHWLTERYCLYAVSSAPRVYRAEIHHRPWPLQPAHAEIARNTMAAAASVELPAIPPRTAFARTLDVVVWTPERVA